MINISTRISAKKNNSKEGKILDKFIDSGFFEKLNTKKYSYTLIHEPYTGFGYADLVCLRWNKTIYERWNFRRDSLQEEDIKILHYLYNSQKAKTLVQIERDLGYKNKTLYKTVDRLISADLITENHKNTFKVRPLNKIFFIYEIIAVEAKIRDWKKALEQSFNNVFFASKSFSLFPEESINANMLNSYNKTEVGLLSIGKSYRQLLKPKKMRIPTSLTAWRFNEMLGRGYIS